MTKLLGGLVPLLIGTGVVGMWLFDSPTIFEVTGSWPTTAIIILEMIIGLSFAIFGICILLTKEEKSE